MPALQHLSTPHRRGSKRRALNSSQEPQEPDLRSFCIGSARTCALEPRRLRQKDAVLCAGGREGRGSGRGALSRLHPCVFRLQATASLRRKRLKKVSAGERPRGTSAAGEAPTECEKGLGPEEGRGFLGQGRGGAGPRGPSGPKEHHSHVLGSRIQALNQRKQLFHESDQRCIQPWQRG